VSLERYSGLAAWAVLLIVIFSPHFVEYRWGEHAAKLASWGVTLALTAFFGGMYYYALDICHREGDDSCGRIIVLWPMVALLIVGFALVDAIRRTRN
jgi:uncharacterized PurR-regulated membrane protein YhhQ (DUF165 family)